MIFASTFFELKEGMYGVAAKKVLAKIMDLCEEYPEFCVYMTDVNVSLAVNGSNMGNPTKFVLWLLYRKLQSLLETEQQTSYNVRLCISKIKCVVCGLPGYHDGMTIPILFNAGLENISDEHTFRIDNFIESVNDDCFEALPRYSESFTGSDDMTTTSDDSASIALS
jgi:hypothetical protein